MGNTYTYMYVFIYDLYPKLCDIINIGNLKRKIKKQQNKRASKHGMIVQYTIPYLLH